MPFDKDTTVVIDGRIIRSSHGGESLGLQNLGDGIEQSLSNSRLVDRIKESKKTDRVVVVAVVRTIDDGRYTADRLAIAIGDKRKYRAMLLDED